MNSINTPLDLIEFIDTYGHMSHTHSSKILELVSSNPEMVQWAANHKKIEKSRTRLLKNKQIIGNPNIGLVTNMNKFVFTNEDYFWLSSNNYPSAVRFIKQSPQKAWYGMLCKNTNPRAVEILKDMFVSGYTEDLDICFDPDVEVVNKSVLNFGLLAANPSAFDFVLTELSHYLFSSDPEHRKIWIGISRNPHPKAIELLQKYSDRIDMDSLASNPNKKAIDLLVNMCSLSDMNWKRLSSNPAAVQLLKNNPFNVDYEYLSANPHPVAMRVFAKWYLRNRSKKAFQHMLQFNFRDKYLHQYVDFK